MHRFIFFAFLRCLHLLLLCKIQKECKKWDFFCWLFEEKKEKRAAFCMYDLFMYFKRIFRLMS